MKPVILTGLRANSEFHIGNYLGGILPLVDLQKAHAGEYQVNMFVPDLHSFTTPIDHGKLFEQTLENLKLFVAAGLNIDDNNTYLYRQSFIPAHSEMTWILSCFTHMGELSRMTQYKEKSEQQENQTAGLFTYPVLMAADILLYGAEWVPVGDDQRQHLELTRDIATRLNSKFGDIVTVPHEWKKQLEFTNRQQGVRIRSLRNPEKKMSKSIDDPAGTIMLSDNPDEAAKKVMGATTDSVGKIHYDWQAQPGITNLLQMLSLLTNKPQDEINAEWGGKSSYGDLKSATADAVRVFLSDLQGKLAAVDKKAVLDKLEKSEKAMNEVANGTLQKVQKAVGLRA